MKDFHMESVKLQRIDLITRTLVNDLYSDEDKEIVMIWLAEMFTGLVKEMKQQKQDIKSPH